MPSEKAANKKPKPDRTYNMTPQEAREKLNIVVDFIPSGNSNRPRTPLTSKQITIHNTDNGDAGANARQHAIYQKGADARERKVSWHFTVDDHSVYQSLPENEVGWHAGTTAGNLSTIAIEICENADGDEAAANERAALLTALKLHELGIALKDNVVQHNHWSGKDCPAKLRHPGTKWTAFLKQVADFYVQIQNGGDMENDHNPGVVVAAAAESLEEAGPLRSPHWAANVELQHAAMSLRPGYLIGEQSEEVGLIQDALDRVMKPPRINAGSNWTIFGPKTKAATMEFQQAAGLSVDGQVGRNTLRALDKALLSLSGTIPSPEPPVTPGGLDRILQIAKDSAIAQYSWNDRGRAPIGYTKGLALVFARLYCRLQSPSPDPTVLEMARADKNSPSIDALSHYRSIFLAKGMDNSGSDKHTLRHLFVLMMGLGMRESSGAYCEGRDMSNPSSGTADSAEAGLFQTSWNARSASPLMPALFETYRQKPGTGFVEVFREHVTCSAADWRTWGTGTGAEFQELSKQCPAFGGEFAGVGLRNIRRHWGPINSQAAEVRPEADAMFREVQKAIDEDNLCPV